MIREENKLNYVKCSIKPEKPEKEKIKKETKCTKQKTEYGRYGSNCINNQLKWEWSKYAN